MMALAKILGVDVWLVKAAGIMILALSLMGGAWWIHSSIYDSGYAAAEAHYTAVIAAEHAELAQADADEQRRQMIANNAAKAREAQAIAGLEAEQAANLELRRKLASEARQDPDAGKPSLGAGSVQRLNQIR